MFHQKPPVDTIRPMRKAARKPPRSAVASVAVEVVQGAGEVASDKIHKRYGWKGCVATCLMLAGLVSGGLYLLRS